MALCFSKLYVTNRQPFETKPILRSVRYVEVEVKNNDVDRAYKVLKRKLQREGKLKALKQLRYYEKPSEKRMRKRAESLSRRRKAERKRLQAAGGF